MGTDRLQSWGHSFHQTFAAERSALSAIMSIAGTGERLTKEQIFRLTGIPTGARSGKVVPHIRYAQMMGLIKADVSAGGYLLELTSLGARVLRFDPYIADRTTMLLCHHNMVTSSGAGLFGFIFDHLIPQYGTLLPRQLIADVGAKQFNAKAVDVTPVVTCYTTSKSFGDLRLLDVEARRGGELRFVPVETEKTNQQLTLVCLMLNWELHFPEREELTLTTVIDTLGLGRPFVWTEDMVLAVLTELADSGFVALNRQLNPVTVIRKANSEHAIEHLWPDTTHSRVR